jgi:hypothetical protein
MMRERIARARATSSERLRAHSSMESAERTTYNSDEGYATGGSIMAEDAIGIRVTPIYRNRTSSRDTLPGLSFSAQLLELGLKHNVEGLIQKAHDQLSYQGAPPLSAQSVATHNYERAQDNFARDSLHMVERNY